MKNYYQEDKHPWGTTPSSVVREFLPHYKKGSFGDIGAGDGRNAVFLAEKGFTVTAVDEIPAALTILKDFANEHNVSDRITTVQTPLADYSWTPPHDNYLATYVLHFSLQEEIEEIIYQMKTATTPGGTNLIVDFTADSDVDFLSKEGTEPMYFPQPQELLKYYHDWEIIHYSEKTGIAKGTDKRGDNPRMVVVTLLARKP